MEDLAAEYVQLVNGPRTAQSSQNAWDILQEMQRCVGIDHTNTYLNRARNIYRMLID
jgi:hypothetical protein